MCVCVCVYVSVCVSVCETARERERAGTSEDKGSLVHSGALSSLHSSFVYTVNSLTSSILHCLPLSCALSLVTHSFSTQTVISVYTHAALHSWYAAQTVTVNWSVYCVGRTCRLTNISHLNQWAKVLSKVRRISDHKKTYIRGWWEGWSHLDERQDWRWLGLGGRSVFGAERIWVKAKLRG